MKQILIYVGMAAAGVGLILILGAAEREGGGAATVYSASVLAAPEAEFDFGTIKMNAGKVEYEFEIKNEGEETITIEKVFTSCMCTEAIIKSVGREYGPFGMPGHRGSGQTRISVGAGEKARVKAIFDPAAHGPAGVGLANRTI